MAATIYPKRIYGKCRKRKRGNFPRVWKPIQGLADFAGRWEP
jgi:hypothetical protein